MNIQYTLLFYTVARFPQRAMRGNMYHTQIVVRQQHRIFLGVSIVGIDFRMAVKVHALGRESQVHGLFVQSVGAGGIHLVVQCQFNDFRTHSNAARPHIADTFPYSNRASPQGPDGKRR